MEKNSEKCHPLFDQIPLQGLSPEEIFQFLKENPGRISHRTRLREKGFFEVFLDFFIDYFYMQENIDLKDFMNSFERALLLKMLDKFNGNQKDTADFLGINHTTLNQKVKKHKIGFFKKPIEG